MPKLTVKGPWYTYVNFRAERGAPSPKSRGEIHQVTAGTDEATGEDHPIVTATMRFEQTGAPLSDDKPVWMRLASKARLPPRPGTLHPQSSNPQPRILNPEHGVMMIVRGSGFGVQLGFSVGSEETMGG